MTVEDHQNTITEMAMTPTESISTQRDQQLRISRENNLNSRVDERMKEIQGHITGIRHTKADRVCLLIEFCYLLDLHEQAVDLHARLDRNELDSDWLRRVDTIVRTSRMKARG